MDDKDWQEFLKWCQEKYRIWKPDRSSVELWQEFKEDKEASASANGSNH